MIPREIIDEVRNRISIVEVVGRYVGLRQKGKSHWGLCPFHTEKTPSFHVSDLKRMFYCYGCQAGGDVFKFVAQIESASFMEVLQDLARQCGVELPPASPQTQRVQTEREQLLSLTEVATSCYERGLARSPTARAYLERRGIPPEIVKSFRLGYAPPGWENLHRYFARHGHSVDGGVKTGLLVRREDGKGCYDRFRDRIIFPIFNVSGKVIGFGGRILDTGEPKYLNSPESVLFNKSNALYGLEQARRVIAQEDCAVVVEGNIDALSLHAAGIRHAVATCGTALTKGHLRTLKRYTRRVLLVYDGDRAGQAAAERSLPMFLDEDLWPYFVSLPVGQDPDDIVRAEGGDRFKTRLAGAVPLLEHVIAVHAKGAISSPMKREQGLREVIPLLARLAAERCDYYVGYTAQLFGVREESIRTLLSVQGPRQAQDIPITANQTPLPVQEEWLLQWLLCCPECTETVDEIKVIDFVSDWRVQKMARWIVRQRLAGKVVESSTFLEMVRDQEVKQRLIELIMEGVGDGDDRHFEQMVLRIKLARLRQISSEAQGEIQTASRGATQERILELIQHKVRVDREVAAVQRMLKGD